LLSIKIINITCCKLIQPTPEPYIKEPSPGIRYPWKTWAGELVRPWRIIRSYPEHYPFFLTAFRTGARFGELLALKWESVNWKNRYIVVEKSFRNVKLTVTKNGKVGNLSAIANKTAFATA